MSSLFAQQGPTWIWYPGDYEVWLSNHMQNRRTERETYFPPFWRMDSHYVLVEFHKEFNITEREEIKIAAEGKYNVKLNGKMLPGMPDKVLLPPGKHKLNIKVYNQQNVPALFVSGKQLFSDKDWLVTFEDKEWIDETGKASSQSGTLYVKAGHWNFNKMDAYPSAFKLPTRPEKAKKIQKDAAGTLVDFGKNTFGFLTFHQLQGKGKVNIHYGESKEEALDKEFGETTDQLAIDILQKKDSTLQLSKGFQYVYIEADSTISFDDISMQYEYLPVADRGYFKSSDPQINKIWEVAKYTMELTSREFYIDGIKRDRWIWSGDAYQSYAMNYYLGFDSESVKRTILALRGKEPTMTHINTIMDYTFYWFLSIYDYYQYTADEEFIALVYPRMKTLMDFVMSRRNKDGLLEGLPGDWVFIDWAEGLSKQGEVSFEQLLFTRSLETMSVCAGLLGKDKDQAFYEKEASQMKDKFLNLYWNEAKQGLVHSRIDGKPTSNITRYSNMFAIFFDYLNKHQKEGVKQHVLLSNEVPKITTPYMRFYELEAMCVLGMQDVVFQQMKDYWGGMLALGASSFWEEYNPEKSGTDHLSMYGRPYGKSLCHSWGASPLYLLGKYYLGVKPTAAGYASYQIEPYLASLQWMEGKVPTPKGDIVLHITKKKMKINTTDGLGLLKVKSKKKPKSPQGEFKQTSANNFEMQLLPNMHYEITYEAM